MTHTYPTDPPVTAPGELVGPEALRIARNGYAAPIGGVTSPLSARAEHRWRLRVALVAAAPFIVGDVLAAWVSYLDDCTIREMVASWDVPENGPLYHDHRGAVRAFEYAATVLDDHARVSTGRRIPGPEVER